MRLLAGVSGRAIVIGRRADGWAAYFVDLDAKVHSIGALTGKELWATKVDDHPAASSTDRRPWPGRRFLCRMRGGLLGRARSLFCA